MKIIPSLLIAAALFVAPGTHAQTQTPPATPCDCDQLTTKLASAQKTLHDWPNLTRYNDANSSVKPPAKTEKRVVFMGDSITDNWQQPQYGGFFPGKPYIDRGISGQTTPQMLIRFRPDVIALQPKVVVILAGTNDIAGNTGPMTLEQIEGNFESMDQLAHANKIRVVLASIMPVSNYGHDKEGKTIDVRDRRSPEKILELNKWIKSYAASHGDIYLDYFSAMVDDHGLLKADLSEDGLHPNAKGYTLITPLAETAIAEALKKAKTK
jgi:lysophospholipase L1-like esterase